MRFLGEPTAERLIRGQLGGNHLERDDPATEPDLAGAVDDRHPAPGDIGLDLEAGHPVADIEHAQLHFR